MSKVDEIGQAVARIDIKASQLRHAALRALAHNPRSELARTNIEVANELNRQCAALMEAVMAATGSKRAA